LLEIEQKFRTDNWADMLIILKNWCAKPTANHRETDRYFNAPDRDFAKTDEVLRLRTIGSQSILTYKGPKRSGPIKTRKEIELPLAVNESSEQDAVDWILALGFRPVAIVGKSRAIYSLVRDPFTVNICFDEVDNVGRFVEVEVVAEEADATAAAALVATVANELGLHTPEPRAYLKMTLEAGRQ